MGLGGLFQAVGIQGEDVGVGQAEAHRAIPVAAEFVLPVAAGAVVLDDQADFGCGLAGRVSRRAGVPPGLLGVVGQGTGLVRLDASSWKAPTCLRPQ